MTVPCKNCGYLLCGCPGAIYIPPTPEQAREDLKKWRALHSKYKTFPCMGRTEETAHELGECLVCGAANGQACLAPARIPQSTNAAGVASYPQAPPAVTVKTRKGQL